MPRHPGDGFDGIKPPRPDGPLSFERYVFPPEPTTAHQSELGLTDKQSSAIREAVKDAQGKFLDLQWEMQSHQEKMSSLLQATPVSESAVLDEADKVIYMERQVKRAHLSLLVKIKKMLTAEQQQQLTELRASKSGPPGMGGKGERRRGPGGPGMVWRRPTATSWRRASVDGGVSAPAPQAPRLRSRVVAAWRFGCSVRAAEPCSVRARRLRTYHSRTWRSRCPLMC